MQCFPKLYNFGPNDLSGHNIKDFSFKVYTWSLIYFDLFKNVSYFLQFWTEQGQLEAQYATCDNKANHCNEKASVHYMSDTEIQWFPCKGVYHEHFLTNFRTPKLKEVNDVNLTVLR